MPASLGSGTLSAVMSAVVPNTRLGVFQSKSSATIHTTLERRTRATRCEIRFWKTNTEQATTKHRKRIPATFPSKSTSDYRSATNHRDERYRRNMNHHLTLNAICCPVLLLGHPPFRSRLTPPISGVHQELQLSLIGPRFTNPASLVATALELETRISHLSPRTLACDLRQTLEIEGWLPICAERRLVKGIGSDDPSVGNPKYRSRGRGKEK